MIENHERIHGVSRGIILGQIDDIDRPLEVTKDNILSIDWHFDSADPYAVKMTSYKKDAEPIDWLLGRDLLFSTIGLEPGGSVGEGDIRFHRATQRRNILGWLCMSVHIPDRDDFYVAVESPPMQDLVIKSLLSVRPGEEHEVYQPALEATLVKWNLAGDEPGIQ